MTEGLCKRRVSHNKEFNVCDLTASGKPSLVNLPAGKLVGHRLTRSASEGGNATCSTLWQLSFKTHLCPKGPLGAIWSNLHSSHAYLSPPINKLTLRLRAAIRSRAGRLRSPLCPGRSPRLAAMMPSARLHAIGRREFP